MDAMTRDDMACRELVEAVTDYLEGALSNADRTRFEEHLDICRGCRTYLDQMRRTIELTGRLSPADLAIEPSTRDRLLAAFRRWRAGEGSKLDANDNHEEVVTDG
jgi:predicted anti-sigma-YlaC factor YlaD